MKLKLLAAVAFASAISMSNAATQVTGTNFTIGTDFVAITDVTGAVTGTFSVAVGTLSTTTFTDAASVASAFTQNGAQIGALAPLPGFFNGANNSATDVGFAGLAMYAVIGNAASFGSSTDYIVIDLDQVWPTEVPGAGAATSFNLINLNLGSLDSSDLLYGTITTTSGAAGTVAAANGTEGLTFGVVPEPSAVLLGGLGFLGLLRRRR